MLHVAYYKLHVAGCRLQDVCCMVQVIGRKSQVAVSRVHFKGFRIKVEDCMLKFEAYRFKLEG